MPEICSCDCGCENTTEWHSEPRCACRDLKCACIKPWDHPYEAGNDNVCINCGLIGSYAHTGEYYMKYRSNAEITTEEINQAYDAWFDEYNQMLRDEALKLGISEGEAALIIYLRERSRWTQEKEDKLIEAAHNGIPWPNILAGEDDEWFAERE